MKNNILLSLLLLATCNALSHTWGAKAAVGLSAYQGDLDANEQFNWQDCSYNLDFSLNVNRHLSIRSGYTYLFIQAADRANELNKGRNLSFHSTIHELRADAQIYLLNSKRNFGRRDPIMPYLFVGAGIFKFNPRAAYQNQLYDLHSLGTEGQYLEGNYPSPYSLFQFCIPFGAGFSFKINSKFSIDLELSYRKTFTDYLDDVSTVYPDKAKLLANNGQAAVALSDRTISDRNPNGRPYLSSRGNPNNKDWYSNLNLGLVYFFLKKKSINSFK